MHWKNTDNKVLVEMGRMGDLIPAMLMVVAQIVFAAVNIFYKLAANDGMNLNIVIAYRFIFGTIFMLPLALLFERDSIKNLTWRVVFQAFLCGLFGGTMAQNLFIEGMAVTSATFVSAISNLIPALTFVLAIFFGLERLGLGSLAGKAKVMGTFTGMGGALLLTLYKGPEIHIWSTHINLLLHHPSAAHLPLHRPNPLLGCFLSIGSCVSFAVWLIIQAKMGARYPFPYSSTALMSLMGSIQSTAFVLLREKDWSQWKLGWNIRLLTVAFTGIGGCGLVVTLMTWAVRKKGPLFVSIFNPLMLLLVAIAGSLLLDESLHLGSILGGALIVCGLYIVLWGKSEEIKMNKKTKQLSTSTSFRVANETILQMNVIISSDDKVAPQTKTATPSNVRMIDLLDNEKDKEQI